MNEIYTTPSNTNAFRLIERNEDVLSLIIRHLRTPRPPVATFRKWWELHQKDLATCMRVSKVFNNATAPILYAEPVVNDLVKFATGASVQPVNLDSSPPSLDTFSGTKVSRQRYSKRECLSLVYRLYLELPDEPRRFPPYNRSILQQLYPDDPSELYDLPGRVRLDPTYVLRTRMICDNTFFTSAFTQLQAVVVDAYFHYSALRMLYPTQRHVSAEPWMTKAPLEAAIAERNDFLVRIARPDTRICFHVSHNMRAFPPTAHTPYISPTCSSAFSAVHIHLDPVWMAADMYHMSEPPEFRPIAHLVPGAKNILVSYPLGTGHSKDYGAVGIHTVPGCPSTLVKVACERTDLWANLILHLRTANAAAQEADGTEVEIVPFPLIKEQLKRDGEAFCRFEPDCVAADAEWQSSWAAFASGLQRDLPKLRIMVSGESRRQACGACLDEFEVDWVPDYTDSAARFNAESRIVHELEV